jgi:hypothetical protein
MDNSEVGENHCDLRICAGGPLLFDQYAPFAILKPKNRKTEAAMSAQSARG